MDKKKNTTPHDTFFGGMMEIAEVAESFFKNHLRPYPRVVDEFDWSKLRIADSARRRPRKNTKHTDITYICETKEGIPIYLHVEQIRSFNSAIFEKIQEYKLGLEIKHRRQKLKYAPTIIIFLLYNGKKPKKLPFHENKFKNHGVPWLAEELLRDRDFFIINLNEAKDTQLFEQELGGMVEILLKRADDSIFEKWLDDDKFIRWFRERTKGLRPYALQDVIRLTMDYMLQMSKEEPEKILEFFATIYPTHKENIMTAAKRLEQRGIIIGKREGKREGIKEGKREGKREGTEHTKLAIAKKMLKQGFPIEAIKGATGLSKKAIGDLQQA